MLQQKIKLSDILRSEKYAIRIRTLEQAKKLVPIYKKFDDLEFFFNNDKNHVEYVGMRFTMNKGFHFYFVHKEGKTIVEFEDVDFDYET